MQHLILTRGLPGSLKSSHAKALVKDSLDTVRVNRDDLRDMLFNSRNLTQEQENAVSIAEKAQVEAFLKAGKNVVVDAMHLRNKYVREWAKIAAKHGANLRLWDVFLYTPLEECIRNDKQREGTPGYVGEDVIRALHKRFFPIPPLKLDDIEPVEVKPYVPIPGTTYAYMVDIDGTVTQGPHERSPYEWMKVGQDKPNEKVMHTVWALHRAGYKIIFCSGRDEVCREPTEEWLNTYFGRKMMEDCPLFMRKQGDMRKDSIVKTELFDQHIRDNYNVIAVFDDRKQVVDMWRSLGLTVFQVAEGDF